MPKLAVLLLATGLVAQSVVVPAANENARGTSGLNTLTRNSGAPRTYMLGIDAVHLTGLPVGAVITGVSFRSNVSASNAALWPPADTDWAPYDVQIGPAIPIANWTTTLASNFAGTPLSVRTGTMRIATNSFTANSALPAPMPNEWGRFYWDFQVPYTYTGGDLALYFSHPGSNGTTAFFLDDVAAAAVPGFTAYSATTQNAATGTAAAVCIVRIHYGYGSGCPGTSGTAPCLVQTNNTTGGGAVTFSIANAPASTPAVYMLGVGRQAIPLPNGCTLLTNPAVMLPVTLDANGRFLLDLTVPPSVRGTINFQSAVVDIGAPGNFTLTNGVEFTAS